MNSIRSSRASLSMRPTLGWDRVSMAAMTANCSDTWAGSGWAKIGQIAAATISTLVLDTESRMLRVKWTLQHGQEEPSRTELIAVFGHLRDTGATTSSQVSVLRWSRRVGSGHLATGACGPHLLIRRCNWWGPRCRRASISAGHRPGRYRSRLLECAQPRRSWRSRRLPADGDALSRGDRRTPTAPGGVPASERLGPPLSEPRDPTGAGRFRSVQAQRPTRFQGRPP